MVYRNLEINEGEQMIILLNKKEVKKLNKGKDVGIQIRDIAKSSSVEIYKTDIDQVILKSHIDLYLKINKGE